MKKILFLTVMVLMLFSSCTVQENVDPILFLTRFSETDEKVEISKESAFFEGNSCVAFFEYGGKRFVIEQFCADDGAVNEICLSSEKADKKLFEECAESLLNVYAPSEETVDILKSLLGDGYLYHETQWYSYSSFSDGETFFFSVKNKKLSPETEEKLTLRDE